MTFSILAHDPLSNAIGGAAATGSLCVGGWVLRGDARAGMSASQGMSPSTLWGEELLHEMRGGASAKQAVQRVTALDSGREQRQASALDLAGGAAAFSGDQNTPFVSQQAFEGGIATGNMLAGPDVIPAMIDSFQNGPPGFAERLIASLKAAQGAGGDTRGLLSAALLIVSRDRAPLTLRIDYDDSDPIAALETLYHKATSGDYARWSVHVPTLDEPERNCD